MGYCRLIWVTQARKLMMFEGINEDCSMAIVGTSPRVGFLRDISIGWGDVRRQWQR